MTDFEGLAKLARDHKQEVAPLVELVRKAGEDLESSGILKEARRMTTYVQVLDQAIDSFTQMESSANELRKRAWRQDPREDPESVKLTDKLEQLCRAADRLVGRLTDLPIDWTLEEYIGSSTGLSDYLTQREPQDVENLFEASFEDMVEGYLDEITRRSYDFRPTLLRQRPTLRQRALRRRR